MSSWTREVVRKKAVRAAAKLALAGTLACGTDVPGESLETAEGVVPPPATTADSVEEPKPVVEAEHVVRRDGTIQVVIRDCTALRDDRSVENWWEAYSACCEAIGWDWSRGCEAWGPPAPPAMSVELA
jgi:hypothetical protein